MVNTPATHSTRHCALLQRELVLYEEALAWQRELVAQRSIGVIGDTLLLLQHPPTITLGRKSHAEHVLVPADVLAQRGVALVESDRGGDATYHAPGQLVGYPILKLSRHGGDVVRYIRNLEEVLIATLATYGISAGRVEGLTGVWVGDEKIAAIGVRLSSSGVTSHGFALNIAPDMAGFAQIIPCGIRDRGVTSLEHVLGWAPPRDEVAARVVRSFEQVFEVVIGDTEE